jgi:hypothetical protein
MKNKRGRPKKIDSDIKKKEYKPSWMPEGYKMPKSYKFLGYCTCENKIMISSKDLISKTIYICPLCNIRQKISLLKVERNNINKNID